MSLPEPAALVTRALRFVGGRVVTPDGVLDGARLRVDDGVVTDLDATAAGVEDVHLDGALLLPGLVDLHTDNLERHYMPRPGAHWDAFGSAVAHDGQIATSGITTVLDSLSLHGSVDGLDRLAHLAPMLDGLDAARDAGALRVEHLLHLRCEVSSVEMPAVLESLLDRSDLVLLSVMDHTPGQGQYHDLDAMRERQRAEGRSDSEIDEFLERMRGLRDGDGAETRRTFVAGHARERALAFASHDDLTVEDVDRARRIDCTIAEFPVSLAAAQHAHAQGMVNALGAPNFVRGGSHSGNLSARDCAREGLLDILCSDYVPLSMLRAVFQLTQAPFEFSLPDAVATASLAPARAVGLEDRGALAVGQRADLLCVEHAADQWPVLRGVWVAGARAA